MSKQNPGIFRRSWRYLRKPSAKWSLLTLLLVGFFGGIIFWGGFHTAIEATNSLAFCTGCHEMRDNVYPEYQKTIHYSNRSGVRAICPDCHVPREWGPKMIRKMQASFELWGKLTGKVDTKEKFNAYRWEMASKEWKRMEANGSRECRNCHDYEAMSEEKETRQAFRKHTKAREEGKTCIDCHKGIAHTLPEDPATAGAGTATGAPE
jgi:cytochrome c-type protein NapC